MKRSPMPDRKTPLRRTSLRSVAPDERVPARRKVTGPSQAVRLLVVARAAGCCEVCGVHLAWFDTGGDVTFVADYSIHHRRPRGAGGTSDPAANGPANLLLVHGTGTTGCHGLIESQRALAASNGWLVPQGVDPASVPVLLHTGDWTYLTNDGTYKETL